MNQPNWPGQQPQNPPQGWGVQPTNTEAQAPPAQTGPPPSPFAQAAPPPPAPQPQAPQQAPPPAAAPAGAPAPAPSSGPVQQGLFDNQTTLPSTAVTEVPTQVQQPAAVEQAPVEAKPSIQQLLRDFAKKDGCDRYKGDAEKIKLLADYLWLRQLTPQLPFELFLELYQPLADFDKDNLKHPTDAIAYYLPRVKKQAESRGVDQWNAKDVTDYVALFVDMIREAEAAQQPIPMELNAFLQSEPLLAGFKNGDFKEAPAPKASRKSAKKAKQEAAHQTPSGVDQRCIYTGPGNRQHRGKTTAYWQDETSGGFYADFLSDTGEEIKGVGIAQLNRCDDPAPNPPQDAEGESLPELGQGKLTIPKAQFPSVVQALQAPTPLGTVAVGDVAYGFNHQFQDGKVALIEVVNGETKPYVDARLCGTGPDDVLAEVEPRDNIEGLYTFVTPEGSYTLEVAGNL